MFTLLFAAITAATITAVELCAGGAILGATLYTAAKTNKVTRHKYKK